MSGIPTAGIEGTDATLTYQLERTRTDLTIEIQESTDLATWTTANVTSTTTVSDTVGSTQSTDAYLLELCRQNQGIMATFDQRIRPSLIGAAEPSILEYIPIESA